MSEGLEARLTVLTRAFALVFVWSSMNADDNESARVVTTRLGSDFHTQFGSVSTRFSKPEQISKSPLRLLSCTGDAAPKQNVSSTPRSGLFKTREMNATSTPFPAAIT